MVYLGWIEFRNDCIRRSLGAMQAVGKIDLDGNDAFVTRNMDGIVEKIGMK